MSLPIDIDYNRVIRNRFQHPDEPPPPVQGQFEFGEDPCTDEPLEMLTLAQDPIETRRRNFERVMTLDRIFDLEHLAHRMTYERAIVDRDARHLGVTRIACTPIDEDP